MAKRVIKKVRRKRSLGSILKTKAIESQFNDMLDNYQSYLINEDSPSITNYSTHVFHQYTIVLNVKENANEFRNGLKEYLAKYSVPAMIYYPVAGHQQKMFETFAKQNISLPVTDWLTERVISLPMHRVIH